MSRFAQSRYARELLTCFAPIFGSFRPYFFNRPIGLGYGGGIFVTYSDVFCHLYECVYYNKTLLGLGVCNLSISIKY